MTLETIYSVISIVIPVVHVIISGSAVVHILGSRKRASPTILWILAVIYLPWVGPVLYLVFGVNKVRRRLEKRMERRAKMPNSITELAQPQGPAMGEANQTAAVGQWPDHFLEFFHLLDNLSVYEAVGGNRCQLMRGGESVYKEMERAIDEAQHSIHLMTYIVDDDDVGRSLFDHLVERAKQGIEVRALVDGYGSNNFAWRRVGRYRRAGIDLRMLRQFNLLQAKIAINLRNHRKILVCDGKVAFAGGMNISERHLLETDQKRPHIDYHTRIEGPVVAQLQGVFAEDWFDVTMESIADEGYFPDVGPVGEDIVRTISGGPDDRQHLLLKAFCAAIQTASESIDIVTPYFVPDPAIIMLLKLAALGGVRTRIIVPGENNHPEIKLASRYRYAELMRSGVMIYERKPPFSHSKLFLVDDVWASIGSANWDMRTFHLQFDTNIGVVSHSFVSQVRAAIEAELEQSERIDPTEFLPRPRIVGAAERFCSLFEDLL